MRVKEIKPSQLMPFPFDDKIQQPQNKKEIEPGDETTNYSSNEASLREQISAIQKAKTFLDLESLAASEFDFQLSSDRNRIARHLTKDPSWYNFQKIRQQLGKEGTRPFGNSGTLEIFVSVMLEIVSKLDPGMIGAHNAYEVEFGPFSPFSSSVLMRITRGEYRGLQTGPGARENSAKILRIIVEKIGDRLDDEAEIIRLLLNSSSKKVREQGAIAAENTYKHKWRRKIRDTGLILAFKKEENDSLRDRIARAISFANPKMILEEYPVGDDVDKFRPLARVLSDRSFSVRINLLCGIGNLLQARSKVGRYYEDFSEIPHLNTKQKNDCLSCVLQIVEGMIRKGSLCEDEAKVLYNSFCVLSNLVSDKDIEDAKKEGNSEYQRLVSRLGKIDFAALTEVVTNISFNDKNWQKYNTWAAASSTANRVLDESSRGLERPLEHYFSLKSKISQKKNVANDIEVNSKLNEALEKVDSAIVGYLANTPFDQIKWGNYLEFNSCVNNLLELVKSLKSESSQFNILSLFENITEKGVMLSDRGKVTFNEAFDVRNKAKLNEVLRTVIYSKPPTTDLLSNSLCLTPRGKALTLYRRITNSYKEYFGCPDLKRKALEFSLGRITGSSSKLGFLLSGDIGAGKSFFAEVLANELAVPLCSLLGSKIEKGQSGELLYSHNGTLLTLSGYFNKVVGAGPGVLLIDELEEVSNPKDPNITSQLLKFLQGLASSKHPVVVIATTNHPKLSKIEGMKINEDGTSQEIDNVLSRTINPEFFTILQPCYLFHKKSVGSLFVSEYLAYLSNIGRVGSDVNIGLVSTLARGLAPADVITSISSIQENPLKPETIINVIKELKLEVDGDIEQRENLIRTKLEDLISSGAFTIEGTKIDFIMLAIVSEEMEIKSILQKLSNAPKVLNQEVLLGLLQI